MVRSVLDPLKALTFAGILSAFLFAPESAVAQTMVSLGMDLGPLTMLRTLKHGLRECMRRTENESLRRTGGAVIEAARDRAARLHGG